MFMQKLFFGSNNPTIIFKIKNKSNKMIWQERLNLSESHENDLIDVNLKLLFRRYLSKVFSRIAVLKKFVIFPAKPALTSVFSQYRVRPTAWLNEDVITGVFLWILRIFSRKCFYRARCCWSWKQQAHCCSVLKKCI